MPRSINLIVIHCSDTPNGRTLFAGSPHPNPLPGGEGTLVTPVQEIDRWHRERGFMRLQRWRDRQEPRLTSIGYHFVIYTRGAVANGRHLDEVGAHAKGYNENSLGVCLIGRDRFTRAQWESLRDWMCGYAKGLEQQAHSNPPALRAPPFEKGGRGGFQAPRRYGNPTPAETREIFARAGIRVVGHRDLDPAKTCPNFGVRAWFDGGMAPPEGQIYPDPIPSDPIAPTLRVVAQT